MEMGLQISEKFQLRVLEYTSTFFMVYLIGQKNIGQK